MNVARNLVRAKTGAKRPIAMDPEGTYKKAKEDLAKMVNSGNPDKDKEETPLKKHKDYANEMLQWRCSLITFRDTDVLSSMADVFMSIANAPKEDS